MELSAVLIECRKGNELAWEELVHTFQGRVYGLVYHLVGNREDAREIAQDVFVKVYQHLDSCRDAQMFFPWLMRISRNSCIDHMRKCKWGAGSHDLVSQNVGAHSGSADNPEALFLAASRRRHLHGCLERLTRLNREVIILKEIRGLSLAQIASLLQIPLGTVKSRSNRARLELAQRLAEFGGS